MKRTLTLIALTAVVGITGCSTKNYGRQPELTSFERNTMTCREIELEEAKVHGFLAHIRKESEFDARSVLSFFGDYGIGNLMERDAAVDSANRRLDALRGARSNCKAAAIAQQAAQPAGYSAQTSKEQRLQELSQQSLSYEEYTRRYREIMAE